MTDPIITNAAAAAATPANGAPPVAPAAASKPAAAAAAPQQVPPQEAQRIALTKELIENTKLTPEERAAKTTELRKIVAAQSTPEENEAYASAQLQEQREMYGLQDPALSPSMLQNYRESFEGWESGLLVSARATGTDAKTVRELRDLGVKLGMQIDGKPIDEATLDYELKKFGTRLSDGQRKSLKAYWRRIEGGGK